MAKSNIEIDSFVMKFKFLLNNGFKASLNVEAQDGEAYITLKAGLGRIQHLKSAPSFSYADCVKQRSPSYYRRQDRRRQSRQNMTGGVVAECHDTSEINVDKCIKSNSTENSSAEIALENLEELSTAEEAIDVNILARVESNTCTTCGTYFDEQVALQIHKDKYVATPHVKNKNGDVIVGTEKDYTLKYWKSGIMIDEYGTYLDVISDIENSTLCENSKNIEKMKAQEARKKALGSSYLRYPPWRK